MKKVTVRMTHALGWSHGTEEFKCDLLKDEFGNFVNVRDNKVYVNRAYGGFGYPRLQNFYTPAQNGGINNG